MFVFGVLSILQMTCLPGLLVQAILQLPWRGVARWVSIFGISLAVNYLLVLVLTLAQLYTRSILLILLAGELVALVWLYRKSLLVSFETLAGKAVVRMDSLRARQLREYLPTRIFQVLEYAVFLLLLVFAVTDLFWMFKNFVYNLGTVFNTWDAIISYNPWAQAWSHGALPANPGYYPQLLPANWSLAYVLLDHVELQIFPKVIMPLFSFFILLMLFDLGLKTRDFGFLIGVIFTRLLIKRFTGSYLNDGVMDLPVSFFGFASIYFLLCARLQAQQDGFDARWLIASGIMAAASALTKQAGLYVLLLFPLLAYLLVLRDETSLSARAKFRLLARIYAGMFLVVFGWYAYKYFDILLGRDTSNLSYVTEGIYGGMGLRDRAITALARLGKYAPLLIAVLPALLFVKPAYRWLGILYVLPYSLIWMFYFSYQTRNLALIFPIWGLLLGLALRQIFDWALSLAARLGIHKTPVAALPALLLVLILAGGLLLPANRLAAHEEEQRWQILDPQLNAEIRALVATSGADMHVLARYPVGMLPGLEEGWVSFWYDNLPDFLQALKDPQLEYLLVPVPANEAIEQELQRGLESGRFELLFTSEGAYPNRMYRINP